MLIAERGRKFQNWNAYSLRSGKTTVPIGCGKAFCASQQQYLPFSALLTWSQLFSSLLMSPELFSPLLSSSELFSFQLFSASPFYAARLNSTLLSSSPVRSSQLIPSQFLSDFHSITLYYKACTKHFPVLLCTTKFAQSTSNFVLLYKTCTKYSTHNQIFTQSALLHTEVFTQRNAYTQQDFTSRSFYTHCSHSDTIHDAQLQKTNLDAAITVRSAKTQSQNTIELRAAAPEIAAPKPNLRAQAEKKVQFWSSLKSKEFSRENKRRQKRQETTNHHSCILTFWKQSFRASLPSQSESWRCENEAFVQGVPQKVKVKDVITKLSCKGSFKTWKLKLWKRSFRARLFKFWWSSLNRQFPCGADPSMIRPQPSVFRNRRAADLTHPSSAAPEASRQRCFSCSWQSDPQAQTRWCGHNPAWWGRCAPVPSGECFPTLLSTGRKLTFLRFLVDLKLKHVDAGIVQHCRDNALQFLQVICFPTLLSSVGKLTFLEFLVDELLVTNALKKQGMSNGFSQDHSVERHIASPTLFPMGTLQGTTGHVPSP